MKSHNNERNQIDVVAALIFDSCGNVLICKRPAYDKHFPDLWEFPGGKIESGETHVQCLMREISEELEIEIMVNEKFLFSIASMENSDIALHTYSCCFLSGVLNLNAHTDFKWVAKSELLLYRFPPADIPVVNKLIEEQC